jgi:hypothetical protein
MVAGTLPESLCASSTSTRCGAKSPSSSSTTRQRAPDGHPFDLPYRIEPDQLAALLREHWELADRIATILTAKTQSRPDSQLQYAAANTN